LKEVRNTLYLQGEIPVVFSNAGLEERAKPSSLLTQEVNSSGDVEDFVGFQSVIGRNDLNVLSEIDESLVNFIPTYRDILTRSPLPIFVGGESLPKTLEKKNKDENSRGVCS
jgi:hypothetical protein